MSSLLMATRTVRTGRSTMLPHLPAPRIRDLACTEPVGEACRARPVGRAPATHGLCTVCVCGLRFYPGRVYSAQPCAQLCAQVLGGMLKQLALALPPCWEACTKLQQLFRSVLCL